MKERHFRFIMMQVSVCCSFAVDGNIYKASFMAIAAIWAACAIFGGEE